MTNRYILVTGGNRGIGAGIVRDLATQGHTVVFSHFGERDKALAVAESCAALEGRAIPIDADFHDLGAPIRLIEGALEQVPRLDALVNNAGRGYEERVVDMRAEDIDSVYAVNFRAPLLLTREFAQHLISRDAGGAVVNIGSVKATTANPIDAVYGGLKAGIQRATESLALALAPRIRVNAVAPGMIAAFEERAAEYEKEGKDVPLRRAGTPADIAKAVRFLLSDDADYITGVTLRVDGGIALPATYGGDDIAPGNRWGASLNDLPVSEAVRKPGGYY